MARAVDADIFIRDLTAMKKMYDAVKLDGMIKALKEAPTIDPVKHGKWITKRTWEHDGEYYCEKCGKEAHWTWERDKQILSDYCPNCGARMDGDSE